MFVGRVTAALAGPSAPQEPSRDKYSRRRVSSYPWASRTWWTVRSLMVPTAAAAPGWPTPTTTWWTTAWSPPSPTRTPQWWGRFWRFIATASRFSSLPVLCLPQQDTQPCYYDSRLAVAHIKDYRFIPKGDEQALADAVATIGPITVAIDASHSSFLFYSSGKVKIYWQVKGEDPLGHRSSINNVCVDSQSINNQLPVPVWQLLVFMHQT